MNYGRALTWMAISAVLFCMIGGVIGFATGILMPEYFQSLQNPTAQSEFDPVAVGIGQGLIGGFITGTVAGLLMASIAMWREVRLAQLGWSETDNES